LAFGLDLVVALPNDTFFKSKSLVIMKILYVFADLGFDKATWNVINNWKIYTILMWRSGGKPNT
jgi:hypothetical protein